MRSLANPRPLAAVGFAVSGLLFAGAFFSHRNVDHGFDGKAFNIASRLQQVVDGLLARQNRIAHAPDEGAVFALSARAKPEDRLASAEDRLASIRGVLGQLVWSLPELEEDYLARFDHTFAQMVKADGAYLRARLLQRRLDHALANKVKEVDQKLNALVEDVDVDSSTSDLRFRAPKASRRRGWSRPDAKRPNHAEARAPRKQSARRASRRAAVPPPSARYPASVVESFREENRHRRDVVRSAFEVQRVLALVVLVKSRASLRTLREQRLSLAHQGLVSSLQRLSSHLATRPKATKLLEASHGFVGELEAMLAESRSDSLVSLKDTLLQSEEDSVRLMAKMEELAEAAGILGQSLTNAVKAKRAQLVSSLQFAWQLTQWLLGAGLLVGALSAGFLLRLDRHGSSVVTEPMEPNGVQTDDLYVPSMVSRLSDGEDTVTLDVAVEPAEVEPEPAEAETHLDKAS